MHVPGGHGLGRSGRDRFTFGYDEVSCYGLWIWDNRGTTRERRPSKETELGTGLGCKSRDGTVG